MHDCITEGSGAKLEGVIRVDESEIRSHVDEVVRQSVEETLNGLLEAEAEQLCGAKRYERSADRADTRYASWSQHSKSATAITVLNLKGGVGKTDTAWLLASVCAERGYRCLCVDLDTQGNLTRNLLVDDSPIPCVEPLFHGSHFPARLETSFLANFFASPPAFMGVIFPRDSKPQSRPSESASIIPTTPLTQYAPITPKSVLSTVLSKPPGYKDMDPDSFQAIGTARINLP